MRYLSLVLASCILVPAARAQPCGTLECNTRALEVSVPELSDAGRRVVALRRVALGQASPGRRVAALRELAELELSLDHRVGRARRLGVLEPEAERALTRFVGAFSALDGTRTARRCVALAQRTFAWGDDARRCRTLAQWNTQVPLRQLLSLPTFPRRFVQADGDAARAFYLAVQRRSDAEARRELAAMQIVMADTAGAVRTLEPLPRNTPRERLAWAEALAASNRGAEALPFLQRLSRETPALPEAVFDHVMVLASQRRASDRASASLVLAGAQHYLCIVEDDGQNESDRLAIQGAGREAAEDLGLDERRPLLPVEHLSLSYVEQERLRPLANCRRAARDYLHGRVLPAPRVVPCPAAETIAIGIDEGALAGWRLRAGRPVRVPERCLPRQPELEDPTAASFPLGDIDGDGADDVAVASDEDDGTYVVGRQIRLLSADGRLLGVLRDPGMRFGSQVVGAGDVDHDGTSDLLVTRPSACDCCDCSGSTDDVLLYLGRASGPPRLAMTLPGMTGLHGWVTVLALGDVDRDGFDDVAIAHGAEIRVHRGVSGGIEPRGRLVHTRSGSSDGLTLHPGSRSGEWWWIDSDAGDAYVVRGTRRPRRFRLR